MDSNQAERRRWNDVSWTALWPKRERLTNQITPVLVEALALRQGERVLDVGCGGGNTTRLAAEEVGASGGAVGADISGPLIELARQRAAGAVGNVSFVAVDAQVDPIPGGPFDVAMSQLGVMFFDDPPAAFANIRSHLVPGARLGFACWQAREKNPWFFAAALADIVVPPPEPPPGKSPAGPFTLADPGRVGEVLQGAGFIDVAIAVHEFAVEVPEDAVVDDAQLVLSGVPEQRLDEAREAVDRHMAQFRAGPGLNRFPLAFQIVTSRNPG